MDWQFTEDRPIWQQLTDQLALRILKGEYPPGERLPGVRELAAQAGVNPNTMQRAMAQLEADGLAVGSRTAGRHAPEGGLVPVPLGKGGAGNECLIHGLIPPLLTQGRLLRCSPAPPAFPDRRAPPPCIIVLIA